MLEQFQPGLIFVTSVALVGVLVALFPLFARRARRPAFPAAAVLETEEPERQSAGV
ncbi:hypothetical protein [Nocardiopsis sp. CNR-923]|uniref:hypothetical protein n=1 Tax=Nocardiopsis sp. CNR-923 TaxID=1904965 RepID=UPI002915DDF1|nr:hypothetical protein [Nocardiopsis sp. CNR-923]